MSQHPSADGAGAGIMSGTIVIGMVLLASAVVKLDERVKQQYQCTQLVKSEVPIKQWPAHCQPPGIPPYVPKSEPRQ